MSTAPSFAAESAIHCQLMRIHTSTRSDWLLLSMAVTVHAGYGLTAWLTFGGKHFIVGALPPLAQFDVRGASSYISRKPVLILCALQLPTLYTR